MNFRRTRAIKESNSSSQMNEILEFFNVDIDYPEYSPVCWATRDQQHKNQRVMKAKRLIHGANDRSPPLDG